MGVGVIPFVLPVLSTESIIFHTCKYLLLTEFIDSRIVSVDSHFTCIIYVIAPSEGVILGNSRSTAILRSINSVDSTGREISIIPNAAEEIRCVFDDN